MKRPAPDWKPQFRSNITAGADKATAGALICQRKRSAECLTGGEKESGAVVDCEASLVSDVAGFSF